MAGDVDQLEAGWTSRPMQICCNRQRQHEILVGLADQCRSADQRQVGAMIGLKNRAKDHVDGRSPALMR